MSKLDEIKKLKDALEVGWLIEPGWDGNVNLLDNLTPFGEFIVKLEHILERDDELIEQLSQLLPQTQATTEDQENAKVNKETQL